MAWDGDTLIAAHNHCVNADYRSMGVYQRAAGVARGQAGVGADDLNHPAFAAGSCFAQAADQTDSDYTTLPPGMADRQNKLPHLQFA